MHPVFLWMIAGLVLLIIELITTTFFLMWIGLGALVTALASIWVEPHWAQWVIFSLVSLILLIVSRPLVRSIHGRVEVPSNVDQVVGQTAIVLEAIDPQANTGRVRIGSDEWRARSDDRIAQGEQVLVESVSGATLRVTPKPREDTA